MERRTTTSRDTIVHLCRTRQHFEKICEILVELILTGRGQRVAAAGVGQSQRPRLRLLEIGDG